MAKYQQHIYIYPHDILLPGHIKLLMSETALCGVSKQGVKELSPGKRIRCLKQYIEDRALCSECETAFRSILAKQSKIVDEW